MGSASPESESGLSLHSICIYSICIFKTLYCTDTDFRSKDDNSYNLGVLSLRISTVI